MASTKKFTSFDDFFGYYLVEHSKPGTRLVHVAATLCGIWVAVVSIVIEQYWGILLALGVGYIPNWISHALIEKNHPTTFTHPVWSFFSDFRMLYLYLTGKLKG